MLVRVPNVLTTEQIVQIRQALDKGNWDDGRHSAGYLSAEVKNNNQLADNDPVAIEIGKVILTALDNNPLFTSAALPLKILPPLFNRYSSGQTYGPHIDGAIRPVTGTPHRIRTDLSATLFLSDQEDYQGGELIVQDTLGERSIKYPAGDMVLYPGNTVHHVTPVTRGIRLASFFWIQSMVRDPEQRTILYRMDNAIQDLAGNQTDHPALVELAGIYHNLLRQWADT